MAEDFLYIKGRLEGLFKLVTILRELSHEEGNEQLLSKIVDHIYAELEEILDMIGTHERDYVEGLKRKIQEVKTEKDHTKKVMQSYDVLSEIMTKEQEQGE